MAVPLTTEQKERYQQMLAERKEKDERPLSRQELIKFRREAQKPQQNGQGQEHEHEQE